MGSVNKAIVVGRLGRDPEVRQAGGRPVANFSIATDEVWNDRDGQRQQRTEWHRIVVWGRQAEICGEYLRKGRQAYVEGRLQTREFEDRDGNQRRTTEIVANKVVFLDGRGDGGEGGGFGGGGGGGRRGGGGDSGGGGGSSAGGGSSSAGGGSSGGGYEDDGGPTPFAGGDDDDDDDDNIPF